MINTYYCVPTYYLLSQVQVKFYYLGEVALGCWGVFGGVGGAEGDDPSWVDTCSLKH